MKTIKFILPALILCGLTSAKAQVVAEGEIANPDSVTFSKDSVLKVEHLTDKYRVVTNYFGHNWFVGAGVGAQVFFADHVKQMKTGDRFNLGLDAYFGKWFTPGIAVRVGLNGYRLKGVSGWSQHKGRVAHMFDYQGFVVNPHLDGMGHLAGDVYGKEESGAYDLYKTSIDYLHAHADVMLDLTQMILGYKPNRFYEFIPYVGVGWMHSLNNPYHAENKTLVKDRKSNELSGSVGLFNTFRLSDALQLALDVRGTYVNDRFDGQIGGRWGEGLLSASLGLVYNIRPGWDPYQKVSIQYNESELQQLRDRLNQLRDANRDLRNQIKEQGYAKRETQEKILAGPLLVTFVIDTWKLSHEARVNLGFLAQRIIESKDAVFVISGYADAGTGSKARNELLSRNRAKVVYDCLVNEFHVPADKLRTEFHGGVDNMYYNDPRCSRSVITKVMTN